VRPARGSSAGAACAGLLIARSRNVIFNSSPIHRHRNKWTLVPTLVRKSRKFAAITAIARTVLSTLARARVRRK
jgi:hypothetical protein